ncbi:MAG TPA: hypothetical protein VMW87_04900 [Spirochaetia bacterium]|nr:hypothetical protein [Spirochaetia bacterium]
MHSPAVKAVALWLGLLVVSGVAVPVFPQQIRSMEFRNQPVTDILLALAKMSGRSIIADPTVTGNSSYFFTQTDFDQALHSFLAANNLFVELRGAIYYVSRVFTDFDQVRGTISVKTDNLDVQTIVRAVGRAAGITVLSDVLPTDRVTLNVRNATIAELLNILVRKYPDYSVETGKDYYYIKKTDANNPRAASGRVVITRDGEEYTINAGTVRFRDAVAELFHKGEREYSLLLQSDSMIGSLHYSDKSFDELLSLVLEQANADFVRVGGIYYLFDVQRRDILKQFRRTVSIPLTYLNVKDLPALMPGELAAGNSFKSDPGTNTIILNGSRQEIQPIENFIREIDRPLADRRHYRFDLHYLRVEDALKTFPTRIANLLPIVIPGTNSFLMLLSSESAREVTDYLSLVDRGTDRTPIQLKYIRSEDLLKNLPPSVTRDNIAATGDSSVIFFSGEPEKRRRFLNDLSVIDKPVPQIRFELLVVQYQRGSGLNLETNYQNSVTSAAPGGVFLGSLSQLLSLNFDIVSTFGYQFALKFNLELSNKTAQVLADTTLNGLSGQQLKFQNTNTYRYREVEIDPDTGKPLYSGVTREITSGLILSVNGWTSGDQMITMQVSATVSKQGADASGSTGNPPTTSEKVVNTNVRTASGRPVIIGGLIQQDVDESIYRVPILGYIPILGLLFQSRVQTIDNTELVIYIVPHVEYPEPKKIDVGRKLLSIYDRLVSPVVDRR